MVTKEIEQEIIDNEKLVYFVINRYFPDFREDEDIIQIGRIGLWKACVSHDDTKSKFSTFAVRCIMNEIKMELRDRVRQWKLGEVASMDETLVFDKDGNPVTLSHIIPDPTNGYCSVDYDISFLGQKLSERDMEVFRLSMYGFTANEIGRAFGYTRAWASRVIKNAQKLCRAMMPYT